MPIQQYSSENTSLNQVPATFKHGAFEAFVVADMVNLDIGGGRFDTATQYLQKLGVQNLVLDPFNRTALHNLLVRNRVATLGGTHTVSVNNVLNVILEDDVLNEVLHQAASALKLGGKAYFLVYEGDRSGLGRETVKGWQRNARATSYLHFIRNHFQFVQRVGNLFIASNPTAHSSHSLFLPNKILADSLVLAKSRGVPLPHRAHGCGKLIGGCLYVHKSAEDIFPVDSLGLFRSRLPAEFSYDIVKWDMKAGAASFIQSPDWNTADEPEVGDAIKVFFNGNIRTTRKKTDPQIYHHKWNFVRTGYSGFDYGTSVLRSLQWASIPCDKSRIGTKSYWQNMVANQILDV